MIKIIKTILKIAYLLVIFIYNLNSISNYINKLNIFLTE